MHVLQEEQPLLESTVQPAETREHKRLRARMSLAMWTSLVANVLLLAAKIVAYLLSHSSAILASAADSFVDIASQVCSCGAKSTTALVLLSGSDYLQAHTR